MELLVPILIPFGIAVLIICLMWMCSCVTENSKGSKTGEDSRITIDDGFQRWQSSGGYHHGLHSSTTSDNDVSLFDRGGGFCGGCDSGGGIGGEVGSIGGLIGGGDSSAGNSGECENGGGFSGVGKSDGGFSGGGDTSEGFSSEGCDSGGGVIL